eukprot:3589637-Prymnesium_polylepis.1
MPRPDSPANHLWAPTDERCTYCEVRVDSTCFRGAASQGAFAGFAKARGDLATATVHPTNEHQTTGTAETRRDSAAWNALKPIRTLR